MNPANMNGGSKRGDKMLPIGKVFLSAALLFPASAFGACTQADLTGTWRFNFNTGANHVSNSRTDQSSCLIQISPLGKVTPKTCHSITGDAANAASITINSPGRHLKIGGGCEVTLDGEVNFQNDWNVTIGPISYFLNGFDLSMSASKDTMVGFGLVDGAGMASVTAVKRVQ